MDELNTSVENQEVAEPEMEEEFDESVENQEVAEPEAEEGASQEEGGKTKQDAAFAEQRRRISELEAELAEKERENEAMFDALGQYFEGETPDDLSVNAKAYAEERNPEDVRAELESRRLQEENERLQEQLFDVQAEQLMARDLQAIQEIDPTVKSLDELGEPFFKMIVAGLSGKEAYYACKAQEMNEKVLAPDAIGAIEDTKVDRDYYTSKELDNLTDEEMEANWDKVMKSMERLGKSK